MAGDDGSDSYAIDDHDGRGVKLAAVEGQNETLLDLGECHGRGGEGGQDRRGTRTSAERVQGGASWEQHQGSNETAKRTAMEGTARRVLLFWLSLDSRAAN